MLFSQLPVLLLAAVLLPSVVEAGLFYKGSPVKMLDAKSFKKAMRENVGHQSAENDTFSNAHQRTFICFGLDGRMERNSKRASLHSLRLGVGYVSHPCSTRLFNAFWADVCAIFP